MYTSSFTDTIISVQNIIKNIQGPCGNSIYESLLSYSDPQSLLFIPRISNKDVIIEQPYSSINGTFGTVKIINLSDIVL